MENRSAFVMCPKCTTYCNPHSTELLKPCCQSLIRAYQMTAFNAHWPYIAFSRVPFFFYLRRSLILYMCVFFQHRLRQCIDQIEDLFISGQQQHQDEEPPPSSSSAEPSPNKSTSDSCYYSSPDRIGAAATAASTSSRTSTSETTASASEKKTPTEVFKVSALYVT